MKHLQWLWAFVSVLALPHAPSLAANLDYLTGEPTVEEIQSWRQDAALQLEQ
jgi:hypothetical protein